VRLTSNAWLCDGQNQISGPLLVYNIREQQIQGLTAPEAAGGADQRVHISIVPHVGKPESTGCAEPRPQSRPAAAPEPAPEATPKS
jgi:hypothetical protein